jgi:hypothetical protein
MDLLNKVEIDRNGELLIEKIEYIIYGYEKSGAMNLYRTARKIWKLSERNYLASVK